MSVRVRDAWLWPDGGRVDSPWVAEAEGGDALAKAGRVVAAQLRSLLAKREIRLRSSTVQVLIADEPGTGDELELTVFDDWLDGAEGGRVVVPAAVAQLSVEQRWWLAFTVLRRTFEELAPVAGGVADQWPLLAEELLLRGPSERLVSAWKAAPDRRHRARLVSEVRGDRPSESWIEIARRGEDEPMGRSPKVPAGPYRRGPEAPTWQGSEIAAVALHVDRGGLQLGFEELTAEVGRLESVEPLESVRLMPEPLVPTIRVTHFTTRDPARPADVRIGEINGEPGRLSGEHRRAWKVVGQARLPELMQWWSMSGLATLHLSAVCLPGVTRASSWMDGRDLWVEVPLGPQSTANAGPEMVALDALQAGVRVAARRAKIATLTLT